MTTQPPKDDPRDDPVWMEGRPSTIVGGRIRQVRGGLSAPKLAGLLAQLGHDQLTKWTITNIETGRRDSVSVDELFAFARALGVAPIHLLVPIDDDPELTMAVTPVDDLAPVRHVRGWAVGDHPWTAADRDTYFRHAPAGWADRILGMRRRVEHMFAMQLGRVVERLADADGKVDADQLLTELMPMIGQVPDGNGDS